MNQNSQDNSTMLYCDKCSGTGKVTYLSEPDAWEMPCPKCQGDKSKTIKEINAQPRHSETSEEHNGKASQKY